MHRSKDFQEADEGIPSNILSSRLNLLLENGLIVRRAYQNNPPPYEYRLAGRGACSYYQIHGEVVMQARGWRKDTGIRPTLEVRKWESEVEEKGLTARSFRPSTIVGLLFPIYLGALRLTALVESHRQF